MSDSLWPHELQHARPPCPSPTPRVHPNPCPSSRWCHPAISSSVIPFFSCPQYFPESGSFQMTQLLASGGQSIGFSASTSVLPMNTQDWSPLGRTGWISLQSKGLHLFVSIYFHVCIAVFCKGSNDQSNFRQKVSQKTEHLRSSHHHSHTSSSLEIIWPFTLLDRFFLGLSHGFHLQGWWMTEPHVIIYLQCVDKHIFHWLPKKENAVQLLSLCNSRDCNTPVFPVHHHLTELAQTHVHWVNDAIQPSYPLSPPSPPDFNLSQHQGLF